METKKHLRQDKVLDSSWDTKSNPDEPRGLIDVKPSIMIMAASNRENDQPLSLDKSSSESLPTSEHSWRHSQGKSKRSIEDGRRTETRKRQTTGAGKGGREEEEPAAVESSPNREERAKA